MKNKIKNNIYLLVGQFFIWVVPIAMLIYMAVSGETQSIKIKGWVVIGIIIYLCAYFVKIKSVLNREVDREIIKDGYIHAWVYAIRYITVMLPFVVAILLLEKIKASLSANSVEIEMFIVILIITISIGYACLLKHSSLKAKATTK